MERSHYLKKNGAKTMDACVNMIDDHGYVTHMTLGFIYLFVVIEIHTYVPNLFPH